MLSLLILLLLVFVTVDGVASVDIVADVRLSISTAELQQLVEKYVPPLIIASGITQPNKIIGEFNLLDVHYVNPILVLDGAPRLLVSSQPGQNAVVEIFQAIHLEAEKKEARFRHNIWPLTHAGDLETVDPHQHLVAGSIHLTGTVTVQGVPGALNTLKLIVHYDAKLVELSPEIDLGQAIPIPGIRDVIQHYFVDKLKSVQGKTDTMEITQFNEKVAALSPEVQSSSVNSLNILTGDNSDSIIIRVSGSAEKTEL